MFISDKLIYLQLEKTACTHIASLLSQTINGTLYLKHNSLKNDVPSKVICGSIRNPWDWYVSLWAFSAKGDSKIYKVATQKDIKNAIKMFSGCEDPEQFKSWLSGQKTVKKSVNTVLNAPKGIWLEYSKNVKYWHDSYKELYKPQKFRQWLKLMCDSSKAYQYDLGYAKNPIKQFAGFMTYRYFKIHSISFFEQAKALELNTLNQLKEFDEEFNILNRTIKCENLESDLISTIKQAGYNLSDSQLNLIVQSSKTNKSKHFDSAYYYDDETIDLVAEKEKFIIEKYSYEPPSK